MRSLYLIFLLQCCFAVFAQQIPNLYPSQTVPLNLSLEGEKEFVASQKKCEAIWERMSKGTKYSELSEQDKATLENCDETIESYWDIIGEGCSWYCGGGPMEVTASSSLSTQGSNSYEAGNAHDLSYQTAWVEGVTGYGIGEYLQYTFEPTSPRINTVIVINGYVKSATAWKNNSRVKKLTMYIDNKPYGILNLKDERAAQYFEIDPIGNDDRNDWEKLKTLPEWTIKFEITDVYKGDKYDDVALTEIYFDGLDVHCLAGETEIAMADGSFKRIEEVVTGEYILSWNERTRKPEPSKVMAMAKPIHCDLIQVTLSDGRSITCTRDHPVMAAEGMLLSFDPVKSQKSYRLSCVGQLKVGSLVETLTGVLSVTAIQEIKGSRKTYTITSLDKNNAFIANGIIVGTEPAK